MKYSDNFKFNLPNKADRDSADIDVISENFKKVDKILKDNENPDVATQIEEALEKAKASGDFDGTSVTIESISESTEDNGSNIVTFSDGNQMTIRNGSQGVSGVYVGDGEMPEGYNVQINPEGDISSGIEQEIIESNENILTFSPQTYTYQGVTYVTRDDGTCYISGTATSSSYHRILDSRASLPNGFEKGKKYLMDYYAIPIYARIQVRVVDSKGTWTDLIDNNFGGVFEIPQSAVGLQVRYYFGSTFKGHCFVKPRIFKEGSYYYNKLVNVKKPMPMLSIIYDDGHNEFYSHILPLIESKNVPIATAIIPDNVGVQSDKMTWDKITECYLKGAEIITHCDVKDQAGWDELGVYGVARHYHCLKNTLNNKGFNVPNVLIFAGSSANYQTCREAAFKIFNAGFNASTGGINYCGILDKYNLNRYGTDNKNLSTLKGWIDDLFDAGTGWMVWTRHNSNATSETPETALQILSDAIDYAIEKGIQIVTVERGVNEYLGN